MVAKPHIVDDTAGTCMVDDAVRHMRAALDILDATGSNIAAAHLSLAIEKAVPGGSVTHN